MKIAVPVTSNNQVDDHFGHCQAYHVFTISAENNITATQIVPSVEGCGCKSNIAQVLAADGVSVMLAGGIGNGAINVLKSSGIDVVRGCSGDSASLVTSYLSGILTDSGESCHHHDAPATGGSEHQCSH